MKNTGHCTFYLSLYKLMGHKTHSTSQNSLNAFQNPTGRHRRCRLGLRSHELYAFGRRGRKERVRSVTLPPTTGILQGGLLSGTVRWRPAQATRPPRAPLRRPSPLLATVALDPAPRDSHRESDTELHNFTNPQVTSKFPRYLRITNTDSQSLVAAPMNIAVHLGSVENLNTSHQYTGMYVQNNLQSGTLFAEWHFFFFFFCSPVPCMQIHSNGFKTTGTYFASHSDPIKTKCVYRKLRSESDFYSEF